MRQPPLAVLVTILVGAIAALVLLHRQQEGSAATPQLVGTWERLPGPAPPPGRQAAPAPLGDQLRIDGELISWDGRSLAYRLINADGLVLIEADFNGDGNPDQTVLDWRTMASGETRFSISFGGSYGSWRSLK